MSRFRFQSKIALPILLVVHILAGWSLGSLTSEVEFVNDLQRFFIGLFFAQVALVSFWGTLGLSPRSIRVGGSLVGLLYLIGLFCSIVPSIHVGLIAFLLGYTSVVLVPLLVLRWRVARLVNSAQVTRAGTQFQIRHLFILTFAISLLLAIGKWLPDNSFEDSGIIIALIVLAISSGSVGVAAVWATLSKTSMWIPAVLLLGYAASAGWFLDTRFSRGSDPYYMTYVFTTEITVLLVSLGIVRLCGYRLVPLRHQDETLPENATFDEPLSPEDTPQQVDPFSA